MADYMPFIVILLALIAALSIGFIAWELSDHKFHETFEQEKRHEHTAKATGDDAHRDEQEAGR